MTRKPTRSWIGPDERGSNSHSVETGRLRSRQVRVGLVAAGRFSASPLASRRVVRRQMTRTGLD